MRLAKALIRLRACVGWSASLLVAITTWLETSSRGSNMYTITQTVFPVYNNGRCPLIDTFSDAAFSLSSDCNSFAILIFDLLTPRQTLAELCIRLTFVHVYCLLPYP